jgi:hypothetical protein
MLPLWYQRFSYTASCGAGCCRASLNYTENYTLRSSQSCSLHTHPLAWPEPDARLVGPVEQQNTCPYQVLCSHAAAQVNLALSTYRVQGPVSLMPMVAASIATQLCAQQARRLAPRRQDPPP